jgi:hypothetical protein
MNMNLDGGRGEVERVHAAAVLHNIHKVGRCRLTVSKPALKASAVSALEGRIS